MFSGKLLFCLISALFLQCTTQEKQIRGLPEVDYPTYYAIPKTSFRCSEQHYNPGFYADTETRCQVFHYCYEHRQESFLCPMGTIFNQPILACDYWYSSNCSLASSYYHVNADKRNDNFEADHPIESQPVNLFDKMAHLYETDNKAPESSDLNNFDIPDLKLLNNGDESSGEPLIESNDAEDHNKFTYNNHFKMVDGVAPEVVKYEVGVDTLNIHKDPENEQYEADEDFIFAEDGMLHQRQEDIYKMYPNDMNFNQEYSGYAEIPSEGNFNYDLNNELYAENDFQLSDFEFQKRYAGVNGNYVKRRPSSRKPVIVVSEEEPETVKLPIVKQKRRQVGIVTPADAVTESSSPTYYDSNIYKEDTSIVNVLESATSEEFPPEESDSEVNHYDLRDPKLFYEIEETYGEYDSQFHPTDSLSVIYNYHNKKTRNPSVLSNIDSEETSYVFGSGSNDVSSFSNVEHQSVLTDSKHEVFIGNVEVSSVFPDTSSEETTEDESSFDSDPFLGSGSEMNEFQWSDVSNFPKDQDIFSDSEDTEIFDTNTPDVLPIKLLDTSERSGISAQVTTDMPNFTEFVNEPIRFVSNDFEGSVKYEQEASSEAFSDFLSLENSEDIDESELVSDGSDGSEELSYLPNDLQESFYNPEDASDKAMPEIREIDGTNYVFSDSEYHPNNYENDDSSGFYSEDVDYAVTENYEDTSDKTTELIDNEGFEYIPTDSELKMDNLEDGSLHTLDYQDPRDLENTYETLTNELESEISPGNPEGYVVDDSDSTRPLSNEDLKFWEMMSQNPSPIVKNLFEVSNEKSNFDIKEEIPSIVIDQDMNSERDINEETTPKELASMEDVYEFESFASDASSVTAEHSVDIESFKNISKKIAEDSSNTDGSGQDESEILLPEKNLEAIVPGKEADPFGILISESEKMLSDGPGSKQTLSLKVPVQPKNVAVSPATGKDLKKVSRGKRFNENIHTFNPPNKGSPLRTPSQETLRETMFTNIPSAFLKMKHSTLRPYFYNYGLESSGFNPRTGDMLQSSKLSKLTSLGKRLLEAKSAKFNTMKKYVDSYRN